MSSINPRRPLHLQVAERLKQMVAREFVPGDILPPYLALTSRFGVGLMTIKRAMDVLAAKGIVSPIRRRGTIVNRRIKPGETCLSQVGLVVRAALSRLFEVRYLSEVLASLCKRLDELESGLRVFSLGRSHRSVAPSEVVEAGMDGVILMGVFDDAYIAELAREDVPLVVLDHHARNIALDYVVCENAGAATALVGHLASLGHERMAFVETIPGGPVTDSPVRPLQENSERIERRDGFVAAMAEILPGLPAPVHSFAPPVYDTHQAMFDDMARVALAGASAPTAVIANCEEVAVDLIDALDRRGVRVPGDVSVAAMAGADMIAADTPPLTYCRMDFHEMGRRGIELLELRTWTPRPSGPNVVRVGFELIEGTTAAPPPRQSPPRPKRRPGRLDGRRRSS